MVDKHARKRLREPEYERKVHYGQLQHIFAIELPAIGMLSLAERSKIFMVAIKPCITDLFDSLGTLYFSKLAPSVIVDMTCVRGVVGRVKLDNLWAIIDRIDHAHTHSDVVQ